MPRKNRKGLPSPLALAALFFAAAGAAAQPTATPSGRTWQSDGSAADVQKIHDRQASDGDTIVIPKGTFSWTSTVRLTKAIILKGQTIRNDDGTSIDNTNIQDNIPRSTKKGLITLSAPGGQRITGIGQNGMIRIQGTTPTRIDHCVFDHLYWSPYVMVNDYNWGVLDHCTKRNPISNEGILHFRAGSASGDHGDTPFTQPTGYGGPNFFFVEDNLTWGGMDLTLGAKVVVRHNLFMNANMASHGTGRTYHDGRGARACEIYDNEFRLNYTTLTGGNSGTVLVHDNLIKKYDGGNVIGTNLGVNRTIYSSGPPFYGLFICERDADLCFKPRSAHHHGFNEELVPEQVARIQHSSSVRWSHGTDQFKYEQHPLNYRMASARICCW